MHSSLETWNRKWLGPTMSKLSHYSQKQIVAPVRNTFKWGNLKDWNRTRYNSRSSFFPSNSNANDTIYAKYSPWFEFQCLCPCSFQADIALLIKTSHKLNLLIILLLLHLWSFRMPAHTATVCTDSWAGNLETKEAFGLMIQNYLESPTYRYRRREE